MELVQLLALIIGNGAVIIPLFLWNRAEARSNIRHMDMKLESYRIECVTLIKTIQEEMKDFHNRLYDLEKSRRVK